MNKKYISLREGFDVLSIGDSKNDLTEVEFKNLSKYLMQSMSKNLVIFSYNSIRFINYVGLIVFENMIIEILPKISLSNDHSKDREMLIFMLSKCRKIPIKADEIANSDRGNKHLLDLVVKFFVDNTLKELEKGHYFEYVSVEESIGNIRGKILVSEHCKVNRFNKNKAYCKYDEFTENNIFNSIIKKAAMYVLNSVSDYRLKSNINVLINQLDEVDDLFINKRIIESYKLNRRNERFKASFELAKMILTSSTIDNSIGKKFGFSLLFEMNYLYEEYIGIVLKEIIEKDEENIFVNTQEKSKYLLYNQCKEKEEIAIKPDIVVYKEKIPKIIIDTKWKKGSYNGVSKYTQADIYQMYAYIHRYKECEKCILLYPKDEEEVVSNWKVSPHSFKQILMRSVDLSSYEKTKICLENLVEKI